MAKYITRSWALVIPAGLGSAGAVGHRLGQRSLCLRLSQALTRYAWISQWQTGEAAAAGTTTENCDVRLRVGRFNSNKACCLLKFSTLSCILSWFNEPRRCMHCKCVDSSLVDLLITSISVTWNKYQYHYWCCWVDYIWGMHYLALSNNVGTALFWCWDEILHSMSFPPAWPLPMVMQCCNGSPGAAILVTMCHMLCRQRLPSLARCSLCHWVRHLYKLRTLWALHRQIKQRLLAQLFVDACHAAASSTKLQRYKRTKCPNWLMPHAVHKMHSWWYVHSGVFPTLGDT